MIKYVLGEAVEDSPVGTPTAPLVWWSGTIPSAAIGLLILLMGVLLGFRMLPADSASCVVPAIRIAAVPVAPWAWTFLEVLLSSQAFLKLVWSTSPLCEEKEAVICGAHPVTETGAPSSPSSRN